MRFSARTSLFASVGAIFGVLGLAATASGQGVPARPAPAPAARPARTQPAELPEQFLARVYAENPTTAGYVIRTKWAKGAVEISGRVGTKAIHDAAVRMAIDSGIPFRDNLVIDTATAHAAASSDPVTQAAANAQATSEAAPYVYPPPLMGRVDDPFFGLVPPVMSYPPWWRPANTGPAMVRPRPVESDARTSVARGGSTSRGSAASPAREPAGPAPPKGDLQISVDPFGMVTLRGVVASEEAGREIEQAARNVPGVTGVDAQFQVLPRPAVEEPGAQPPPPPEPMLEPVKPRPVDSEPAAVMPAPAARQAPILRPTPAVRPEPAAKPASAPKSVAPSAADGRDLSRRVAASLTRRPLTAELAISVRSSDGVVTLAGTAPSALEAMIAFRAAQQTPGVHSIVDHLDFPVPDENTPNPLVEKGRPEDVEPYLSSQIQRHLGDIAQLDRIHARGDILELRGTLLNSGDKDRVLAIIRSIPLLEGFHLDAVFSAD